jgi:hypothetical protein
MKKDKRVDESIEATLNFASHGKTVIADVFTDMNLGNIGHIIPRLADAPSIKIELERAMIYYYKYVTATFHRVAVFLTFFSFMMPHLYHYIEVTEKTTGAKHSQKHYNFGPKWGTRSEPYWSTYRFDTQPLVGLLNLLKLTYRLGTNLRRLLTSCKGLSQSIGLHQRAALRRWRQLMLSISRRDYQRGRALCQSKNSVLSFDRVHNTDQNAKIGGKDVYIVKRKR